MKSSALRPNGQRLKLNCGDLGTAFAKLSLQQTVTEPLLCGLWL